MASGDGAIELDDRRGLALCERCVERGNALPVGLFAGARPRMAGGDGGLQGVGAGRGAELLGTIECSKAAANEQLIPAAAVLIEQQDGLARRAEARSGTRGLNFHQRDQTVDLRLGGREAGEDAAEAQCIFAQRGTQPVFAGGGGVALVEDEIDDFEHGRQARGAVQAGGNFEGHMRFGERALGAHDALRDGGLRSEKGAGNLRRGEAAEQAQGEGDARFGREHGMAGDEDEAEQIVLDIAVGCAGEGGGEVGEGALLLVFELAGELFVFLLDARVAAQQVDGAVLGGGHEPRAGVLRHAGRGPLFECGDQRVLGQLFGDADIAHDARQSGDDARGLHAPHGVDGAIDLAAVDVSGRHETDQSIFRGAVANAQKKARPGNNKAAPH